MVGGWWSALGRWSALTNDHNGELIGVGVNPLHELLTPLLNLLKALRVGHVVSGVGWGGVRREEKSMVAGQNRWAEQVAPGL